MFKKNLSKKYLSLLLTLLTVNAAALLAQTTISNTPPGSQNQEAQPTGNAPLGGLSGDAFSIFQQGMMNGGAANGVIGQGGLGITTFGDQVFYTLNLSPEITFGKVGVGFDLNLRVDQRGNLRQEDWNDGVSSYLRLIRYVRYGFKYSDTYVRAGQLDAARMGHGTIMNLYRNNGSYDARRVGVEFDMDFGKYGFESVVSDLSNFNIIGIRPYYRPLAESGIPVLSGLTLGATYAADFNTRANVRSSGVAGANAGLLGNRQVFYDSLGSRSGNMTALGIDIGLPLLRLPIFESDLYFDYAKLIGYGDGLAAGITGRIPNILGVITVAARLEHRVVGNQFQFAYFDALYEQDRFQQLTIGGNAALVTRANELANFSAPGPGVYGDLGGDILGKVRLFGSYQRLYRTPRGGQLHLGARLIQAIPNVLVRADYFKRDIGFETELFTLDDRSLSQVEVGYYPYPYVLFSLVYQWTYAPTRNSAGNITGFDPIRRIEPRVTVQFNL
jgi:hypothetical protein